MTKSAKEKVNHYIDQCSKRLIHIKVKNEFFVTRAYSLKTFKLFGSMIYRIYMLLLWYVIAKRHVMLYRFVVNWVRS